MTVNELIQKLSRIKNKDLPIGMDMYGFKTIDDMIGISVYPDCVVLQEEVIIPKEVK
jgi:hypothetical protein